MTKRILSVVLVLTVFFGGYAVLPKKFNPLPVNEVVCATNYGGVYQAKNTFTFTFRKISKDKYGNTVIVTGSKTYYKNKTYTVTSSGYDGNNPYIYLAPVLSSNFYLLYH